MRFFILQKTLDVPEVETLKRALRNVPGMVEADALVMANDAYGVLAKRPSAEEAFALQQGLQGEGIETYVVEEKDLPELPPTKSLKRIDCLPEGLIIYDVIGRNYQATWDRLTLVAAGSVMTTEFNKTMSERMGALPDKRHDAVNQKSVIDYKTVELRQPRLLLELVLDGVATRYSIKADDSAALLFQYLGGRRSKSVPENFTMLVRDLMQYAPRATVNRGAYYLREGAEELFSYPSKHAFYEEIVWLLWHLANTSPPETNTPAPEK